MIIPAITLPDGGIDEQGRRKPGTRGPEQVSGQVAMADVITGEVLKRIRYTYPNKAGILATGGGVLFTGYEDGALVALHDETLEELWRFESGIGIKAGFMTYAIGGQQFVAIQAGARTVNREELGESGGAHGCRGSACIYPLVREATRNCQGRAGKPARPFSVRTRKGRGGCPRPPPGLLSAAFNWLRAGSPRSGWLPARGIPDSIRTSRVPRRRCHGK